MLREYLGGLSKPVRTEDKELKKPTKSAVLNIG